MFGLLAQLSGAALAGALTDQPVPEGWSDAAGARRVALVVGVDSYEDGSLGALAYAANDATDIAEVLEDPGAGAFYEVQLLTGGVTRADIQRTWSDLTATLTSEDTFVVYFAGHGTVDLDVDGSHQYLLVSDSRLDSVRTSGMSVDDLQDALELLPAEHRVLVVDACYNGNGRSALSEDMQSELSRFRGTLPPPPPRPIQRFDARLFAAHLNQAALEDPELGNGVYTHFLVRGLRGEADLDGDGLVDVVEAHQFARDQTLSHTGGAQVPWLDTKVVGRSEIFLAGDPERRRVAERALIAGLDHLPKGARVLVDGMPRGEGALDPGRHRVEVRVDDRSMVRKTFTVRPGDRLHVGALAAGREEHRLVGLATTFHAAQGSPGGPAVAPAATADVDGWWFPRDPNGIRFAAGARTGVGVGPVPGLAYFPTGDALVRGAAGVGERRVVAGTLGAGVLWRMPSGTRQAGPLLESGVHSHVLLGRTYVGADLGVRYLPVPVDGVRPVLPTGRIGAGFRI